MQNVKNEQCKTERVYNGTTKQNTMSKDMAEQRETQSLNFGVMMRGSTLTKSGGGWTISRAHHTHQFQIELAKQLIRGFCARKRTTSGLAPSRAMVEAPPVIGCMRFLQWLTAYSYELS